MQLATIEFARNVCDLKDAHSTEFKNTKVPVIALLEEWMTKDQVFERRTQDSNLGGTMRLGAYDCNLIEDSKAYKIYNKKKISERHRQ